MFTAQPWIPSLQEKPLDVCELRVLAHWLEHYPRTCGRIAFQGELRGDQDAVAWAVRVACASADHAAALMLARHPDLSLFEAKSRCWSTAMKLEG